MTTTTTCPACRTAETAARAAWIESHVHETAAGRWVIAQHDARNVNWTASMTPRAQRLTGCSGVSSRTLEGIASDGNVATYASRAGAIRAAAEDVRGAMSGALCRDHARQIAAEMRAEDDRRAAELDARLEREEPAERATAQASKAVLAELQSLTPDATWDDARVALACIRAGLYQGRTATRPEILQGIASKIAARAA